MRKIRMHFKKSGFIYSLLVIISLTSCSKVFYSKDATEISRTHKVIAIVPPKVTISSLLHISDPSLREQLKNESSIFQKEMYMWVLNKKNKHPYNFEVLDIEIVNSTLKRNGYFSDTSTLSPFDMSKLLEVNAVLTSSYTFTYLNGNQTVKNIAEANKITSTNQSNDSRAGINEKLTVTYSLYDLMSKKLIWNFDKNITHSTSGYFQSQIVKRIFRQAFNKIPYNSKSEKI